MTHSKYIVVTKIVHEGFFFCFSYSFGFSILSVCNTSFFANLFEANNLPLCDQEVDATMGYVASLVDDAGTNVMSFADNQRWFQVMAGHKYTSGKNCEQLFWFLAVLLQLVDF